ncbi:MAG: hypothetical protein ACT4NX_02270 [Deltaproteobacteria bacterium]
MNRFTLLVVAIMMSLGSSAIAGELASSDAGFIFGGDRVAAVSVTDSEMQATEGQIIGLLGGVLTGASIFVIQSPVFFTGIGVTPLGVALGVPTNGVVGGLVTTLVGGPGGGLLGGGFLGGLLGGLL